MFVATGSNLKSRSSVGATAGLSAAHAACEVKLAERRATNMRLRWSQEVLLPQTLTFALFL